MKIDKIRVDRAEYEALCELRDTTHAAAKRELAKVTADYESCLAINRGHVARISTQDLELNESRAVDARRQKELVEMRARVSTLETENAAWRARVAELEPRRSEVPQPMFAPKKGS